MTNGEAEVEGTLFGFSMHYSVAQISKMWGLSGDTVRRIFEKEPDVLVLADGRKGSRRTYRTLRIPAHVVARVHKRLTSSAAA